MSRTPAPTVIDVPLPDEVLALARALIAIPSVSGAEDAALELLADYLRAAGLEACRHEGNLYAVRGAGRPRLLLNSHADVVPPGDDWTRDPWTPAVENGRLYGRGATDAKGAVAAQLWAFLHADMAAGSVVWSAVREEETNSNRGAVLLAPHLEERFGVFDGVVVGEPTAMQPAIAQRGLLRVLLHAPGRACHAARPWQGDNPLLRAARDIVRLEALAAALDRAHPLLGRTTIAPTMIAGGYQPNVIPDRCTVTYDLRTTPAYPNDEVLRRLRATVESEVELRSDRLHAIETDPAAFIVRAAVAATGAAPVGMLGVSDWFWFRRWPGLVLGPGDNAQSHAADEYVTLADLARGAAGYRRLIEGFLAGAAEAELTPA